MDFKSFIKKALLTALTLAVCIPVILKVASANANASKGSVDVAIQFFDAAGNEISNVNEGDTVTLKVTLTPKYSDGTPVNIENVEMFSAEVSTFGFRENVTITLDHQTSYTTTLIANACYSAENYPSCIVQSGLAYYDFDSKSLVSGNHPDYIPNKGSIEFGDEKSLTMPITPTGPSGGGSSGDGSNGDSDANDNPGSSNGSSGGSSSSSDSAPAAGGGAAAPAGGGAAGNAGSSTVGGVYTATSMNNVAVTSPAATVAAAIGLSEADVAAGTNVRTYICDSRNREMKDALKTVAEANGRSIVAYIDIDLYTITKAGVVTNVRNTAAPVTITFGLPGSLANAGHTYSVLCLNPDGTPAIFEDIDTNNATVTINATAFGTYAIMINP